MGNGAVVLATSIGSVKLYFSCNKFMVCKDIYLVPDFGRNIFSFAQLMKQGFVLNVNNGIEIYYNGNLITATCLINDHFYLKPIYHEIYNTTANSDLLRESKRLKLDLNDQTYMWHLRLGHIRLDRIKRLVKDGPLESLQVGSLPTCESCLEGKMT